MASLSTQTSLPFDEEFSEALDSDYGTDNETTKSTGPTTADVTKGQPDVTKGGTGASTGGTSSESKTASTKEKEEE